MAEQNIKKAKEYATSDEVMKEYVDDSNDIITDNGFGESYDHEWALKDQGRREGKAEGIVEGKAEGQKEAKRKIAQAMLKDNIDINTISKYAGLNEETIKNLE